MDFVNNGSVSNEESDMLVVTIGIQMHGAVINPHLDDETIELFKNVRLHSMSCGFKDYETSPLYQWTFPSAINDIFRKDIETSTYDIITSPKSRGIFFGNITFDKMFSTEKENYLGIYLASIHENRKLIFPKPTTNEYINLLKMEHLQEVAKHFRTKTAITRRLQDLSTPFPSSTIYREEEDLIKNNEMLSAEEKQKKIKETQQQFYNIITKWQLTTDDYGNIESIKLSTLVEMIKTLIKKPCVINILDYSCSSLLTYQYTDFGNLGMPSRSDDIESGINTGYGGRTYHKKKKHSYLRRDYKKKTLRKKYTENRWNKNK